MKTSDVRKINAAVKKGSVHVGSNRVYGAKTVQGQLKIKDDFGRWNPVHYVEIN